MTFHSQGQRLQIAYQYHKAARSNNKTVVLLHGKNFSTIYWKETIQHLAKEGYSVLAIDQIGFGRSSQPIAYKFSFHQLAANTKLLMDSLHISKATLIGHSMGGMIAIRFALLYPKICAQLILENPIGLEDWKLFVPYATVENENQKELLKTREDLKVYMTKNYFHNEWKKEYETLLAENDRLMHDKHFPAYAKNMALTSDMIFTQPVCYEFKNIKVPVTLIIGQADRTTIGRERAGKDIAGCLGNYPELGRKTVKAIDNAKLIELQGIGHIPHVENFKTFIEKIDNILKN